MHRGTEFRDGKSTADYSSTHSRITTHASKVAVVTHSQPNLVTRKLKNLEISKTVFIWFALFIQ